MDSWFGATDVGKGENYGELPAPFQLVLGTVSEGDTFKVGDLGITVKESASNAVWDSKTGIVFGDVTENSQTKTRAIRYIGQGVGNIPVSTTQKPKVDWGRWNGISCLTSGLTLKYNYWYY